MNKEKTKTKKNSKRKRCKQNQSGRKEIKLEEIFQTENDSY